MTDLPTCNKHHTQLNKYVWCLDETLKGEEVTKITIFIVLCEGLDESHDILKEAALLSADAKHK